MQEHKGNDCRAAEQHFRMREIRCIDKPRYREREYDQQQDKIYEYFRDPAAYAAFNIFLVFVIILADERYLFIPVEIMAVMPDRYSEILRIFHILTLLDTGRMPPPYRPRDKVNKKRGQLRYDEDNRK